jgi:dTDP-4-amino-4,6-dideoxygalactose transaminase
MQDALSKGKISGDGFYTKKCENELTKIIKSNVLLTTSCTHSLEMIALLEGFTSADEILVPAFTFVSSALAFDKFGCDIKFVDVDPYSGMATLNDYTSQISSKTKAIVVVHYGGKIANDIESIAKFCKENEIILIEDAAQAIGVYKNNNHAGTFGDYGAISFHETKNITSGGEGGALIVANEISYERAYVIRDKGTNRRAFFNGMVDKYSWKSKGSSYVMSDLNAAYLLAQIENLDKINNFRKAAYEYYFDGLIGLKRKNFLKIFPLQEGNGHMFYLLISKRDSLLSHLRKNNIEATFHYLPLNNSDYVQRNADKFNVNHIVSGSNTISKELIRLPLYFGISRNIQEQVISVIKAYFHE